jgi:hypothetical protein
MTVSENSGLIRIEEKVDRLMEYMAASNERVQNCKKRFNDIEEDIETMDRIINRLWLKVTAIVFIGLTAVWFVEHFNIFGMAK